MQMQNVLCSRPYVHMPKTADAGGDDNACMWRHDPRVTCTHCGIWHSRLSNDACSGTDSRLTCTSCIIWRSRLSSSLGYLRVNRGMPRFSKALTKELWKGSTGQSRVPASGKYPRCMLVFHCDRACALSLKLSMFFVPGSSASS